MGDGGMGAGELGLRVRARGKVVKVHVTHDIVATWTSQQRGPILNTYKLATSLWEKKYIIRRCKLKLQLPCCKM